MVEAAEECLKGWASERPPGEPEQELESSVLANVNQTTERYIAERNLRFKMCRVNINTCNPDDVKELKELMEKATETKVAQNYIDDAGVQSGKMEGNIQARDIRDMLKNYPPREYPEPEEPVKGKGGKMAAKPPAKAPPKKKKKKEPPFPTPEWAIELDDVISTVKNMESLVTEE